jgi:hypothetical protein
MSQYQDWLYTSNVPVDETTTRRVYYFEPGQEYGWKDDDGKKYYRLNCSYWFGDWIEEQDRSLWRSYGGRHRAIYIVREELMTLIRLKWL